MSTEEVISDSCKLIASIAGSYGWAFESKSTKSEVMTTEKTTPTVIITKTSRSTFDSVKKAETTITPFFVTRKGSENEILIEQNSALIKIIVLLSTFILSVSSSII